jgi:hypothetical protein
VLRGCCRVHRFAIKFAEGTSIMAHIEANNELQAIDRIAAEILQLVTAGLSNIRRHTQATRAIIDLSQSQAHFILARLLPFLSWRKAAFHGAIAVDDGDKAKRSHERFRV